MGKMIKQALNDKAKRNSEVLRATVSQKAFAPWGSKNEGVV